MKSLEKIEEIEARRIVSDQDALSYSRKCSMPFRETTKLPEIEIDPNLASLLSIETAWRRCRRAGVFSN